MKLKQVRGPLVGLKPRLSWLNDDKAAVSRARDRVVTWRWMYKTKEWQRLWWQVLVAQAARRFEVRGGDAPFVPPFTPGQIGVARDYRTLSEQRDGSAMCCASLEAGRGGGGSGLFIDSFIDQGNRLAELHRRIGQGRAMDVRRHMDRGNARRSITVRAALDMVVLAGRDISAVLVAFGWAAKGSARKALRVEIAGALDRMQGYKGGNVW